MRLAERVESRKKALVNKINPLPVESNEAAAKPTRIQSLAFLAS